MKNNKKRGQIENKEIKLINNKTSYNNIDIFGFKKTLSLFVILFLILTVINTSITLASIDNDVSKQYETPLYQGDYKSYYNQQFADANSACCLELNNGAVCQNVPSSFKECKGSIIPTSCDAVAECQIGCCIDQEEGLCTPNAPEKLCTLQNGRFDEQTLCGVSDCKKDCCILNGRAEYVTEDRCEKLSVSQGVAKDFRQVEDEIQCLLLADNLASGACVFESGSCVATSQPHCDYLQGNFHEGLLCSSPSLETGCKKQSYIDCAAGKSEIYWYDSCGNRENIYSSDKDSSWNGGKVLTKSESCNPNSANTNSADCGNCNYLAGSQCARAGALDNKVRDGNFICQDLSCTDDKGNVREKGESWCVYDGNTGEGNDPVGSRHWREECTNGEVKTVGCADYRNEVCAEEKIKNEAGKEISSATCRINKWQLCGGLEESSCEDEKDCMWQKVEYCDTHFNVCTPQYAPGFDLFNSELGGSYGGMCSAADLTCDVVFICGKCVANCDCLEEKDTISWNNYCKALGDCGADVNYVGKVTEGGYSIKEGEQLGNKYLDSLKDYIIPDPGEVVPAGDKDANDYLKGSGGGSGGAAAPPAGGAGGGGAAGAIAGIAGLGIGAGVGAYFGGKSGALIGLAIGGPIGALIAGLLGGGALGGLLGGDSCPPEIVTVEFQCLSWQPPSGDSDCGKCNEDKDKPCTAYKCASLGAACVLLNPETSNPECVALADNDGKAPELNLFKGQSKFDEALKEFNGVDITDYSKLFDEISGVNIQKSGNRFIIKGESQGECLPAFSPVSFKLETSKPSECRISLLKDAPFEAMTPDFLERNAFTTEHTFLSMAPSLDSIEIKESQLNLNIYVKCQDVYGNINSESYILEMCLSSEVDTKEPKILSSFPSDNGYYPFGSNSTNVVIITNEPAECRVSKLDTEFNLMENRMNCYNNLTALTPSGWVCTTVVNNLGEQNTLYARCEDQPWQNDASKRNSNSESYKFTFSSSKNSLIINSITPSGDILRLEEPAIVELKVKTSGGVDGGAAVCKFSETNKGWNSNFFITNSNEHSQTFTNLIRGIYDFKVTCTDIGGNVATNNTKFNLAIDREAPLISRIFNEAGSLKMSTNEEAECYYSNIKCSFDINESSIARSMTKLLSKDHSAPWNDGLSYYIKCKDVVGNSQSGCYRVFTG